MTVPKNGKNILQLYNKLLLIEYSPMVALNRTYALARANGKPNAIIEAEKLNLTSNHLYFCLMGYLYTYINNETAIGHLKMAFKLAKSKADKETIGKSINKITTGLHK